MIQPKDIVTLLNLACGFVSIVFAFEGNIYWAANFIFIAYFFDTLDGPVAKWIGKPNRFGEELDNVCDAFSFGLAPAFLAYAVFKNLNPLWGYALGFWLVACSTLRTVRFSLIKESLPGYFFGLPRPASAMMLAAMVNSWTFRNHHLLVSGSLVVFFLGWMNMSFLPYLNHHNHRQPLTKKAKLTALGVSAFVLPTAFIFGYPWEGIFLCLFLYALHPLFWIRGADKVLVKAFTAGLRKNF